MLHEILRQHCSAVLQERKWFSFPVHYSEVESLFVQITQERELYSLMIPEVFKEDAGNFVVKATNAAGEAKCYASLNVKKTSDQHVVKTRLVSTRGQVTKAFSPHFSRSCDVSGLTVSFCSCSRLKRPTWCRGSLSHRASDKTRPNSRKCSTT